MTDAKKLAAAKKAPAASPPKKTPTKAVQEILDAPRSVTIQGLELEIPAQLPFEVLRWSAEEKGPVQMMGILNAVLGEEQMKTVWSARFTMQQGMDFTTELMAEYGTGPGESSASSDS